MASCLTERPVQSGMFVGYVVDLIVVLISRRMSHSPMSLPVVQERSQVRQIDR